MIFAVKTGIFPVGGLTSIGFEKFSPVHKVLDIFHHLFLPILVLSTAGVAGLQRQMREISLMCLKLIILKWQEQKDYPKIKLYTSMLVRNAINPMVTMLGFEFASLLSGAALTEYVFAYPGLGRLILEAVLKLDINLVMASLMMGAIMLTIGNLIADILLKLVDPRITLNHIKLNKESIKLIFKRLIRDKFALAGLIILIILYVSITFANFFAPYQKDFSDRHLSYAPPSIVFTIDQQGHFSWPYIYNYKRTFNPNTFSINYKPDRSKKYYLHFFSKGFDYRFLGIIPTNLHLITVNPSGRLFLLGSDINGRDNFSRLLYGGQISLTIGFLALFISFPIGLFYGGIAGYFGGKVDNIMMRIAEAIMSIPGFYLLISLAAILPANMTSSQRFALITIILAFIGWADLSRVVRGMVLSIKNLEFVEAAEAIGTSTTSIIIKHILPQITSYVIVAMTLCVPGYILAESGLSFLGLGIQQPDASWGNMLKEAQQFFNIINRPWLLTPGFLIFIAVLSFNLVGDAVRDILDPRSKVR